MATLAFRGPLSFRASWFQVENDVGQVMVVTRDERSGLGFNFLHVIDCIGEDDAIPCSVGIHR